MFLVARNVPGSPEIGSQLREMYSIRDQGPTPADATYHLHRALGTSPYRLCGNGGNRSHGQEACGKERVCRRRPFHPICARIRHKKPYGQNNSPSAVQQLLLRFWVPTTLNVGPRNRILRESYSSDV